MRLFSFMGKTWAEENESPYIVLTEEEMFEHEFMYREITEQLLFANTKYERMDMAFMIKISSLDYGERFRVIVIGFEKKIAEENLKKIRQMLQSNYRIVLSTVWNSLLICILPEKMILIDKIKQMYHLVKKQLGTLKIAGSTIKLRLEDSHIALQEAIRTYDMIESMKKNEENIMFYEDLGIFGLLYDLNETTVFETYYNGIFQNIWAYDKDNEGHLFETLECYFKNDCNKLKTAKELYIHENTLRYRLHQIEEVMDCNLKNVNTITDIVTALKVRRMLQILDKV